MPAWNVPGTRQELVELLDCTLYEITALRRRTERDEVDAAQIVVHLEALARLDRRRDALLDQLRHQASSERRRDEDRSIRQFILLALDEVQGPQTAGFLEDYVYARKRVMLKSRNFGALRRDENRSWTRPRSRRSAYIVPCLDEEGQPVPRWMARSDWPLTERIFIPGVETLWGWMRVVALTAALREKRDETAEPLYIPLVEKYAAQARGEQSGDAGDAEVTWEAAEQQAHAEVGRLREQLTPPRVATARRLAEYELEQQLWGISSIAPPTRGDRHAL